MAPYDNLDDDELRRTADDFEDDSASGALAPDDTETVQTPEKAATAEDAAAAAETPEQADKRRLQGIYRDALSRYGQAPQDDSQFKRLQLVGLLGQGLGAISSGIARQSAAGYFGGTADPTAVAQARAQLMQQANGAGEPIAQLAQAPVQQYIQRRQQELAARKQGATELLDIGKAQYYAGGGRAGQQKSYTPEQIEGARALAKANGVADEALAGVTPDNVTKVIAEQGKNKRAGDTNDIKLQQMQAREDELTRKINDRRTSEAERRDLLRQRLDVQKARLNLQGSVQGMRAEADIGQRQVPGVEFDTPLAPKTATELVRRKGYTAESMRSLHELADTLESVSAKGQLLPNSPEYGRLKALYYSLGPKAIAGEFGNSFTEGHAHVVQQMIENPQGFRGWALTPAIAAAARKSSDELDHGYRTAVEQAGGHFIGGNPYATGTPGKTKNYSPAPVRAAGAKIKQVTGNAPTHYAVSPDGKQRIPLDAQGNPMGPAEAVP
jgi:hypothetical protein